MIEMVIYIGFLGVIAIFAVNFLILTLNSYSKSIAERAVISNARLLLETASKAVSESQEVYSPTSRFYTDSGQLSLITPVGVPLEHVTAYTDFWIDNGFMHMRKEGNQVVTLSSPTVRVNRFWVERIIQGLGREAVKMTIQVSYANPRFSASTTLYSTITLRGSY